MKYLLSCTLLAVISIATAQQYPFQRNKNLGSVQYHPRQTQPQPSYNVNKQVQYQEYHQQPYKWQQYRQPIIAGQSTPIRAQSAETSFVDSTYTQYNGGNTNDKNAPQPKLIPTIATQAAVTPDTTTKSRKTQILTPEIEDVNTAYKQPKDTEDEIESEEDNIDLNAINDSATRATMLWRAMAAEHPGVAAKAAMYWRVKAVRDAKGAAEDAMAARKMIATGPEEMARVALAGVNKQHRIGKRTSRSEGLRSQSKLPPYWREYAAHDPEVTARSAMYWVNDERADMYW